MQGELSRMVKNTDSTKTHSGATASKVAGNFRIVSVATAISRVSGFFRDQLNSWIFGAGLVSDSYFAALRIPNLLRCLLYTSPSPRDRQKSRMPSSA